ncbi:MAG: MFS transporter [Myxococcota bacterium]|nr:MFS transporter [Myxococcota bacterium]MDW8362981.1 MFS transporter [Myxococcales bacterium]
MDYASLPRWAQELIPIALLLLVVSVVVWRLPHVDLGHSAAYRRRRFLNWFPVGLTYAFLYMGRYNLTAFKNASGMSHDAYGTIDGAGALVYGCAFILNGPLTDRLGGKVTILLAAVGAAVCNAAMGVLALDGWREDDVTSFTLLYAANMYFQSFGAVSIVKLNAPWFHLRERGTFGGIFGILISLGLWFAYDWAPKITAGLDAPWAFFVPAIVLLVFAAIDALVVRNTPGEAGHRDFDTGDAGSQDQGPPLGLAVVARRMLTNPVILTIAGIELCSGFLRNAIMKWYQPFAKATGITDTFVPSNWGLLLCLAGILGGIFAGAISDHVFGSRRGPVASILYAGMVLGCVGVFALVTTPALGWVMVGMSLCVIGVHGMLSGTASMDFGGKRNTGLVVGIIDGFVYLGTGLQALTLKRILPDGAASADAANWRIWAVAMAPAAVLGLLLALRVWNARPATRTAGH